MYRSKSMDHLEVRRRNLANDVRSIQYGSETSMLASILPHRCAVAGASEAALRRVELWAQLCAEHGELVSRAMDLDRITADAIGETQALAEADRIARLHRHGLKLPDSGPAFASFASARPPMALYAPTVHAPLTLSRLGLQSPVAASYSMLAGGSMSGAFPELLAPPSSYSMPYRYHAGQVEALSPAGLGTSMSASRTLDFSYTAPQPEAPRPAIYSSDAPRHRPRASRLEGSPRRPVLPSRAEASYAAESPRQHSPYRQQHHSNSFSSLTCVGSTLPGGGIAEIRARRERLAREVHRLSSDSISTTWRGPHL